MTTQTSRIVSISLTSTDRSNVQLTCGTSYRNSKQKSIRFHNYLVHIGWREANVGVPTRIYTKRRKCKSTRQHLRIQKAKSGCFIRIHPYKQSRIFQRIKENGNMGLTAWKRETKIVRKMVQFKITSSSWVNHSDVRYSPFGPITTIQLKRKDDYTEARTRDLSRVRRAC